MHIPEARVALKTESWGLGEKKRHLSSTQGQQMDWKEHNLVAMHALVPAAGIKGQLFSL